MVFFLRVFWKLFKQNLYLNFVYIYIYLHNSGTQKALILGINQEECQIKVKQLNIFNKKGFNPTKQTIQINL